MDIKKKGKKNMWIILIYSAVSFIDICTGSVKAIIDKNFVSSEFQKGVLKKLSILASITILYFFSFEIKELETVYNGTFLLVLSEVISFYENTLKKDLTNEG